MMTTGGKLTALFDRFAARPDTGPMSFALSSPGRGWEWSYESEVEPKPYFAASITKLYTAAVIMQLRHQGAVSLADPFGTHLEADLIDGLNTFRGTDHSHRITVRDLLAHSSGVAGYFDQKRAGGGTVVGEVLGQDRAWTLEEAIRIAKQDMSPHFAPGTPGKAFYSDTNYHLLGRIIENVTGNSWERAVTERIILPLGLTATWPFSREVVGRYDEVAAILNGPAPVRIPLAMASVRAHGGLVSTASDGIIFLRAVLGGILFPSTYLHEMQEDWRRIFFPLRYGLGIMRYGMPRLLSGPGPREFLGHSGSSGAVLFYAPSHDLYVSGTVNQLANRSLVYRLMSRAAALAA
ncbi:serine hydrolase domain-containing protein [Arthrobacter wenxiniae]|uniref:Beta-lactamase family protein n=1 Tax=Arthrobacter wenxiniae TaxID=2713570 RepID=A0A7Y7IHJ8_9MICC|nr:serine hydrolase domain-containing protein [Arthrobacter wenxiniae]NVM95601.1 beta-lactamase family protein [Arthrobacter wenxiniae]